MRIEGKEYRTIWYEGKVVKIIDQTKLPHKFIIKEVRFQLTYLFFLSFQQLPFLASILEIALNY